LPVHYSNLLSRLTRILPSLNKTLVSNFVPNSRFIKFDEIIRHSRSVLIAVFDLFNLEITKIDKYLSTVNFAVYCDLGINLAMSLILGRFC
jgi:hypothetical protein